MQYLKLAILLFLIVSCKPKNNTDLNNNTSKEKDSTVNKLSSNSITANVQVNNDSTSLIDLSNIILNHLKAKDYDSLSEFIHPELGLRFSPYGTVDTVNDQVLSQKAFIKLSHTQKAIKWGIFDGTGEPINLNIAQYFKRFVYDVDFLNPEKRSVNKIIGESSSLNNMKTVYPDSDFTEFYFSGFDPKYQGMDWKTLVLVFKKDNTKTYLIGIIHDQWRV